MKAAFLVILLAQLAVTFGFLGHGCTQHLRCREWTLAAVDVGFMGVLAALAWIAVEGARP